MIKFVNGKSNKMFQQAVIHYTFCMATLYNGHKESVFINIPPLFFALPAAGAGHSFDLISLITTIK